MRITEVDFIYLHSEQPLKNPKEYRTPANFPRKEPWFHCCWRDSKATLADSLAVSVLRGNLYRPLMRSFLEWRSLLHPADTHHGTHQVLTSASLVSTAEKARQPLFRVEWQAAKPLAGVPLTTCINRDQSEKLKQLRNNNIITAQWGSRVCLLFSASPL